MNKIGYAAMAMGVVSVGVTGFLLMNKSARQKLGEMIDDSMDIAQVQVKKIKNTK